PVNIDIIDVFGSIGTVKDALGNVITSTTTDENGRIGTDSRKLSYHISTKGGDYAKIRLSSGTFETHVGTSVKMMTTGGTPSRFEFVTHPDQLGPTTAGAKSTPFTIEKRDDFDNPTGVEGITVTLESDSPCPDYIFWTADGTRYLTEEDRTFSGWTSPVWPVPTNNCSRISFRYVDPYSSLPVGEDGTPNTPSAGLPARPALGKWIITAEYGVRKGTCAITMNPGSITRIGFDIFPSTAEPIYAGLNENKDGLVKLEIETQDSLGNPNPVASDTVINLTSD
ncbi:unnamed protein product, partial [marine sediment metagenome]